MQVNNRITPPTTQAPSKVKSKPVTETQTTAPTSAPTKTEPKVKPTVEPIQGGPQEEAAVDQQIDARAPEQVQQQDQKLAKIPQGVKVEKSILGDTDDPNKSKVDRQAGYVQDAHGKLNTQLAENTGSEGAQGTEGEDSGKPPIYEVTAGAAFLGTPTGLTVRFKAKDSNFMDSGMTLALSGGVSYQNKSEFTDNQTRVLHVRSRHADLTVGVSGTVVDLPVSGSIGGAVDYDVAYSRAVRPTDQAENFYREKLPTRDEVQANPLATLGEGDEIAFRKSFRISVEAGATDPHTQIHGEIGFDVKNEFITTIKRNPGDPPTFLVHVEPGNREIEGHAAVGLGPFAVTLSGKHASTVYYEFEMTPEALSGFLDKGKLPPLPKPSHFLASDKKLKDKGEEFEAFKKDFGGMQLVGFGATKAFEVELEGSVSMLGKAKTSTSRMEAVYVRENEILREDVHKMKSAYGTYFSGTKSQTLSMTQGNSFKKVPGQEQLQQEYVGLEASYKLSRTENTKKGFQKDIDRVNELLGDSAQPLYVALNSEKNAGETSVQLTANITPQVLGELEALGTALVTGQPPELKSKANFTLFHMESQHEVPREAVEGLLQDLHALKSKPGLEGDADALRREQGLRVAAFLSGSMTSAVNKDELKNIAVLQRLVGSEHQIVTVKASSDIHNQKLDGLHVAQFLASSDSRTARKIGQDMLVYGVDSLDDAKARISQKPGDRFKQAAIFMHELEEIRSNIEGDAMLSADEKGNMLRKVDDYIKGLNRDMDAQLSNPLNGAAVLTAVMEAGPSLPKSLQGLYHSAEEIFMDPNISSELIDRTLTFSIDRLEKTGDVAYAGQMLSALCKENKGVIGVDQALRLISLTDQACPQNMSLLLSYVDPKDLRTLAPRMNDVQRETVLNILNKHDNVADDSIFTRITSFQAGVSDANRRAEKTYKELGGKVEKLEKEIGKLHSQHGVIFGTETTRTGKDKPLMDHFKKVFKDGDEPKTSLSERIDDSYVELGADHHQELSQRMDTLGVMTELMVGKIGTMKPEERQLLFNQIMKQDVMGEVSQKMLQHLIGTSTDNHELAGWSSRIGIRIEEGTSAMGKMGGGLKHAAKAMKMTDTANTEARTIKELRERLLETQLMMS